METTYLEKYFYTDLVKLILDYVNLTKNEDMLPEIPDKYIGNITVDTNENKYVREYRKFIRRANIDFNNIPNTLINLTKLYCQYTNITEIPNTLINLTYLNCASTDITEIPNTLINLK